MYSLEGTVLIQSSLNFKGMVMIIISRSISKLGHVGSKSRSLGQMLKKTLCTLLKAQFRSKVHETLSYCYSS